jgi:MSHA type pilus biogenesis protein MshL
MYFIYLVVLIFLSGCSNIQIEADPSVDSNLKLWEQYPVTASNVLIDTKPIDAVSKNDDLEIVSVQAYQADIDTLLTKLFEGSHYNFVLSQQVSGKVSLKVESAPLNLVLDEIVNQLGIEYLKKSNTFIFQPYSLSWRSYSVDYVHIKKSSIESIDLKMSVANQATPSQSRNSSTLVKVESDHDFWAQLQKVLTSFAQPSHQIILSPETGTVSVYATNKIHKAVKSYLDQIHSRIHRQVMIEATVVEVSLNKQYQTGIDWKLFNQNLFGNDGGLSLQSPVRVSNNGFTVNTINATSALGAITGNRLNILASIELLQTFGDSKVLSSPKIRVLNNQTALLKVVNNLVYFTVDVNTTAATANSPAVTHYETEVHTVPVGFTMSVTPFVGDSEKITLNVRPTISRHVANVDDPNPDLANAGVTSAIPIIQEKEISTVLRLQNQATAIIGGLIEQQGRDDRVGLPGTESLPLFDFLFQNRDQESKRSELIIFLRPIII